MTAGELLDYAAQLGLHVIPDGANLRVRPGRLCPPHLADMLRAHKPELLALLSDTNATTPSKVVKPYRALTEREWALLVRAGAEHDPIIIEALRLFDGTIVE